jgi:hypothetical protein
MELQHMFRNAGFQRSELFPLENSMESVVVSRK